MNIDGWIRDNQQFFGSDYEIVFARSVLPLVNGLDLGRVSVQYPFFDKDGRQRYCDFAIVESDDVRLAIEIDGYDKRGTGAGMSHADFIDWQRRQASLAATGWHVLRFANKDVRDYPSRCAEYINQLLNKLRDKEGGRVRVVTVQASPPKEFSEPRSEPDQKPDRSRSVSKLLAISLCTVAVIAFLGSIFSRSSNFFDNRVSANYLSQANKPELRYGDLRCDSPLDWKTARENIGRVVTLVGPMLSSKAKPDLAGSPLWIDVGNAFPAKNRLSVVIWGQNWHGFHLPSLNAEHWANVGDGLASPYICLQGKVEVYKGVPQIELIDKGQLKIFLR